MCFLDLTAGTAPVPLGQSGATAWAKWKNRGSYQAPLFLWRPEVVPSMCFLGFLLRLQNSTKIKNGNHRKEEEVSSSYLDLAIRKMDRWWLHNLWLKSTLQFSQNALQGLVNGK